MVLIPIKMPQLGESIAEATVMSIDVAPGTDVAEDCELFQVETNKATMGVPPPSAGRIVEISAVVDQSYAVGAILAYIEVDEETARRLGMLPQESTAPMTPTSSNNGSSPTGESDNLHFRINTSDAISTVEEPTVQPTVEGLPVPARASGATFMSPRMKARMEEIGLNAADLAGVAGSGAGGRLTIEDFEKFLSELDRNKMTTASPMRIAVADSMRRSWTRPLATVGRPVLLDNLLNHRRNCDPKPGITLYAMRAMAIALSQNTAAAGRLIGERIVHPEAIDIGFAVEVEDGVLVPVIRKVDQMNLRDLTPDYENLVRQARLRRLPREASGAGIATVTNFGAFGIVWATPIPLPEQNLVLGIGAGRRAPIWDEASGAFVPRMEAQITLSFDHRNLDGGAAGRLLEHIDALLQTPEKL
ncbi:MAG: 2-oxo acid dehydrogenase subunit E2 [Verrucomicrobiales bacterium]|nr:2-oxo acid dehydrogenase subunit E2 [Verrucomicrobiae bacterium]MCP5553742.1 2-oxo acid dehydrogenase subunit E2 [Akkermansiaceae bacterium]HRX55396.1 2-oxo acid dehydrogenase subunit E2 [Verrucomicrobiales bacterium]